MSTLKVDTIKSDTTPTVNITDGLSVSGITTSTGKIVGLDVIDIDANNKALRIGGSQELQLTYTGSAAEISNIDASSPINIKVKDGDETAAAFKANGAVDLYHNNVRTFATDSAGAIVYGPEGGEGHLYLFADEGDDNADKWRLNAHTNGNFYLQEKNTGSWVTKMYAQGGAGTVALMHGSTQMFETTSTGVKIPVATSGHGITIESTTNVYPQFTFNADRSGEDQSCGYLRAQWNDTDIAAIDFVAGADTTNKDDGHMRFQTRSSGGSLTERVRITSSGKIDIASRNFNMAVFSDTGGSTGLDSNPWGNNEIGIRMSHQVTGGQTLFAFFNPNGQVGYIQTSGSGTIYNTGSDYRLKENQVSISDGITRLKQLKPYRFNFKKDPSTILDGFFAHEVQTVVPEAISGTKDQVATKDEGVRKTGDVMIQGMDYGRITPLLTAALQEAVTKIETLETKVAALESA